MRKIINAMVQMGSFIILFFRLKNGAFSSKAKKHNLMRLKTERFIIDCFELQFDTATLIIPSFRMTQARGCKERFKYDLSRNYLWYLIGFICNTIIQ